MMGEKEKDIVLHASGLYRSKESYRNHYCTELSDPTLNKLVVEGIFSGPHTKTFLPLSEGYFFLTDLGIQKAYQIKLERGL